MSMDQFTGVTGNPVADGLTRAGWVAAVQAVVCRRLLSHRGLWQSALAPDGSRCLCGAFCRFPDEV